MKSSQFRQRNRVDLGDSGNCTSVNVSCPTTWLYLKKEAIALLAYRTEANPSAWLTRAPVLSSTIISGPRYHCHCCNEKHQALSVLWAWSILLLLP